MMLKEIKYEFFKCDECRYKCPVPGSAHYQCSFDWIGALKDMTVPYYPMGTKHGITSGWYNFPFEFCPIWMALPCPAFHDKADTETELRLSDETLRLVMGMKFSERCIPDRVTEEEFKVMIEKYNKIMKGLHKIDSE